MKNRTVSIFLLILLILASTALATEPVRLDQKSSGSRLLKTGILVYPPEAKEKGLEGIVVLEIIVDEQGKCSDVKVIKNPGDCLAKAAVDAVKQWEYQPYLKDGKPKSFTCTVTVKFKLVKDKAKPAQQK